MYPTKITYLNLPSSTSPQPLPILGTQEGRVALERVCTLGRTYPSYYRYSTSLPHTTLPYPPQAYTTPSRSTLSYHSPTNPTLSFIPYSTLPYYISHTFITHISLAFAHSFILPYINRPTYTTSPTRITTSRPK